MTTISNKPSPGTVGVLWLLAGTLVFGISNAVGKHLIGGYPVGEVLAIRCVVALAFVAPFLRRTDSLLGRGLRVQGLLWLRLALSAVEVMCFYWALTQIGLADITTLYLAGPIYVTGFAALLLREKVGLARWVAVLVGFVGVLVALRPSGAAPILPALVGVAGSLMYALSLVITRQLRGLSTTLLVVTQLVSLLVLGVVVAAPSWRWPGLADGLWMLLLGVLSTGGYLGINRAFQLAPASLLAPFSFSSIIWSIVLGMLVFGEFPGPAMLIGAAIIIAAGLWIALRGRT